MDNSTLQLKIKQRLNKLASNDYDNIECWQIVEAFNKGQISWCRRQLHGSNVKQTGDEESKRRIDDLQIILIDEPINMQKKDGFYESTQELPDNYLEWKKINGKAIDPCCKDPRDMMIWLVEEGNIDEIRRDEHKKPSFEWAETVCTLKSNRVRIYTNNDFDIPEAELSYYRKPIQIQIQGCVDPYTSTVSTANVECEFKDDIVELLIDEAAKILAGDIESYNQAQIANKQVEENN